MIHFNSLLIIFNYLSIIFDYLYDLSITSYYLLIILKYKDNTKILVIKPINCLLPRIELNQIFSYKAAMNSLQMAYRFVCLPLAPNSMLCVICGSEPSYRDLNNMATNIFRNDACTALLQGVERCIPRSLPENLELDSNMLALIMAHMPSRKCTFTRQLHQNASAKRLNQNGMHRLDMLLKFFDHSMETAKIIEGQDGGIRTEVLDQYWSSDYHKCYALMDEQRNVIFVLFGGSVTNHTMK